MRELEELEAIHEEELLLDSSLELRMTFFEELLTSLRVLDELFTSLRELEELEAIHEEEEDSWSGVDLRDELLLDPSLELRMTFCEELLTSLPMLDELFTSLRELEELEAIHEEEEDSGSGTDLRDELLLDPIASLQDDDVGASSDDNDAFELDRFSDHASSALEESSPHATTKNNEERGNKNRFINTSLTFSPFVNILLPPPKINTFMQQNPKYLTKITIFSKIFR